MSKGINADKTREATYNEDSMRQTDVLIIGAGLAGLSTALSLPKSLTVTVLSKSALEICSSYHAQGGIAASLDKEDSVTNHIADTLTAGAGLCEIDNTARILSEGQQAVQWLCQQGVPFTQIHSLDLQSGIKSDTQLDIQKKASTELRTSDLHLTKEGGHGCRRVAHADDATGRHIMEALLIKAQAASNITLLSYHEALQLLTAPLSSSLDNTLTTHCHGALVFDHINQRQFSLYSGAVVLASGGLGQLFMRASAPDVCVGDGVMMAWQAGCRLANLEFIQFHPTGLALDDSSFLISEALRGEGGYLYCPNTNTRFMLGIDARAELAPRDIVARAIAEQIDINGLGYVHLDVSHLPAIFIKTHFPQIYQTLLTLGIDMTTAPIPVAPTAHYSCGGVVTSADGLTDVAGLYAAGEIAYTGLHGANRLASNSLLECVVVGRNIAMHLPHYLRSITEQNTTLDDGHAAQSMLAAWTLPILKATYPITVSSPAWLYTHDATADIDITHVTTALKLLMTTNMGIVRHANKLEQAFHQIQQWRQALESGVPSTSFVLSDSLIKDLKDNRTDLSLLNDQNCVDESAIIHPLTYLRLKRQLQLATLVIHAAYQRCESRGGHTRQDYPDTDSQPRVGVIYPSSKSNNNCVDKQSQYHDKSHLGAPARATKMPEVC